VHHMCAAISQKNIFAIRIGLKGYRDLVRDMSDDKLIAVALLILPLIEMHLTERACEINIDIHLSAHYEQIDDLLD